MKRLLTIASVAALCGALPAIVLAQSSMMSAPNKVSINLYPQNHSGEFGGATLRQSGSDVIVMVHMRNAVAATQPIHIHEGTCDKLNPKPKYPLTSVQDGDSYTVVKDVQLSALLSSPFAINVHKSPNEVGTYVSCGNIVAPSGHM